MKNSADLRGCYPARPSASVDNTLLDLQNSSYPMKASFNNNIAKYLERNHHQPKVRVQDADYQRQSTLRGSQEINGKLLKNEVLRNVISSILRPR